MRYKYVTVTAQANPIFNYFNFLNYIIKIFLLKIGINVEILNVDIAHYLGDGIHWVRGNVMEPRNRHSILQEFQLLKKKGNPDGSGASLEN